MARKYNELLADSRGFERMRSRLPQRADTIAVAILAEEPDLPLEHLHQALAAELALEPLVIEPPHAIRILLEPKDEVFGKNRYTHEASVRYRGSRQLWSTRPGKAILSRVTGRVAAGSVTIENWFKDKRFDAFEQEVVERVAEFTDALPLHQPDIDAFNAELPDYATAWLNGRKEDLVGWRRRGRQIKERSQRRLAQAMSEEPIDPVVPMWKRYVAALTKEQRNGTQ